MEVFGGSSSGTVTTEVIPVQLIELAQATPAVEAKVAAWRLAVAARVAAWAEYQRLSDEHNVRSRAAYQAGERKARRSKAFMAAERAFAAAEHRASYAAAEIEMELRVANPGTDNRSIMATKRALTGPAQ